MPVRSSEFSPEQASLTTQQRHHPVHSVPLIVAAGQDRPPVTFNTHSAPCTVSRLQLQYGQELGPCHAWHFPNPPTLANATQPLTTYGQDITSDLQPGVAQASASAMYVCPRPSSHMVTDTYPRLFPESVPANSEGPRITYMPLNPISQVCKQYTGFAVANPPFRI